MSGLNESHSNPIVSELVGYPDEEQAEMIADHYATISQLYKPLSSDDFPEYENPTNFQPPKVTCKTVEKAIKSMNKKAAGVPGDVPMKLISALSNLNSIWL